MERNPRHLILIGMMGTGKTTVGKKLATHIGLSWKDTDQQLEERWGMSVAQFFQERGESAFREEETKMLQELLKQSPTLITTGGGIVLRRENVELMQRHGWVVALFAEPEVLIQRLAHDQTRPMLQGDVRGRILQIVEERAGKYDFADLQVDTSTRQPDEVVAQIASFWNKKQV